VQRFRSVIWLLSALAPLAIPVASMAQISIRIPPPITITVPPPVTVTVPPPVTVAVPPPIAITVAPPELPVYEQPALPAPGYIWTPGYWAYGSEGYFWVPGTWVQPPSVGLLWTPGYWGWRDGVYGWNAGYWGPHIGFYGGVNYGFGYGGVGFEGGHWNNGVFAYNRTVNNFGSVTITNVYSKTIITEARRQATVRRVAFNGGTGGIVARPTPQEEAAAREPHVAPTPMQTQHEHTASTNRALLASENHGHPAIAATSKPGEFTGKGVVAAREAKPSAAPPRANPTNTGALGKTELTGKEHATSGGTQAKPPNTEAKSVAAVPPPKAAAPNPALHAAAPSASHPVAAATPSEAKPLAAAPPPKAATPNAPPHAATPPAPHPVAAAPHPAARGDKKPPG
jgi:WXXGXW repeat (2 copies)